MGRGSLATNEIDAVVTNTARYHGNEKMPIWLVQPAVLPADLVAEDSQNGSAQAGATESPKAVSSPDGTSLAQEGGQAGSEQAGASYSVSFFFEKLQGLVNPVRPMKMLAEMHATGSIQEQARPNLLGARTAAARAVPSDASVATQTTKPPAMAGAINRDVVERAWGSARRAAHCGPEAYRACRPYPLRISNVP
jgi:hypothetical protein